MLLLYSDLVCVCVYIGGGFLFPKKAGWDANVVNPDVIYTGVGR